MKKRMFLSMAALGLMSLAASASNEDVSTTKPEGGASICAQSLTIPGQFLGFETNSKGRIVNVHCSGTTGVCVRIITYNNSKSVQLPSGIVLPAENDVQIKAENGQSNSSSL